MNWDMLGHEWAVSLLKEHVVHDRIRHAYLITGPHGIGRRTLALRLAQALNCLQPVAPGEPCLVCRACQQIGRMQHPDLAIVQSERRGAQVKVEQVRELQRSLSLTPYEGRYRVALFLHFEDANQFAANALLKTLEEPAPQVILVLTAENAEILLPTIVSRCEVLRLRPLPVRQVCQGLQERWGAPSDQAALLAAISGGRPGYALQLYQDAGQMEQRKNWLNAHDRLLAASRVERFRFAEAMWRDKDREKDKEAARGMVFVWLSLWRDVMLVAAGAAAQPANLDYVENIGRLAQRFGLQTAQHTALALERTVQLMDQNVNLRLVFEVLMLDLPFV